MTPEITSGDATMPLLQSYHHIVQRLLHNRGISDDSSAHSFIAGDYETGMHDPYLLNDMSVAVARICAAIDTNEHIVIYSDYDCDGIPGAVVLHDFFTAAGYSNFSNYIPHRHYEGFGYNVSSLTELTKRGAKLVITIDCGTTDHAAVEAALALGIDTIITDHHEPKETLPAAVAVVNPKVGTTYPFAELCGAGVVFKLTQALLTTGRFGVLPGREKWWLDMVGLATIADLVPLVDENRIFARYGLMVLRKSRRPGLVKLLQKQGASQRHLTEDDIGFTIGPRLNAASRMDAPEDAFRLLATTDEGEAAATVAHLEKLNLQRKGTVAAMTREAHSILGYISEVPDVIVFGNPLWRPSLVGLVANKLAEEHNRPAFIWGRDGNGVLKGSARSNGVVSVVRLMEAASATFAEFGGHHFSGGFSLHEHTVHTMKDAMQVAYATLGEAAHVEKLIEIDSELQLADVTPEFVDSLMQLAPFGIGNPKPLFQFTSVTPYKVQAFGKAKEHTKLSFKTNTGWLDAIAFFTSPAQFNISGTTPTTCTLTAHIERSFFMGRLETRLRIVDIIL